MNNKEYKHEPPVTPIVAEPTATYGYVDALHVGNCPVNPEPFEDEWERSLTIEEFRTVCKKELKDLYATL